MEGDEDALGKREMFCRKDVKKSDTDDRGKDEQGALPSLRNVCSVVKHDQALDNDSNNVRVDGNDALPRDRRKPAYMVSAPCDDVGAVRTRNIA